MRLNVNVIVAKLFVNYFHVAAPSLLLLLLMLKWSGRFKLNTYLFVQHMNSTRQVDLMMVAAVVVVVDPAVVVADDKDYDVDDAAAVDFVLVLVLRSSQLSLLVGYSLTND